MGRDGPDDGVGKPVICHTWCHVMVPSPCFEWRIVGKSIAAVFSGLTLEGSA